MIIGSRLGHVFSIYVIMGGYRRGAALSIVKSYDNTKRSTESGV
jgi:hypothetical protein